MGIFGWDLPPGCRVSDIPGNRPEDGVWESIIENFWDKKRIAKIRVSTQAKRTMGTLFRRTKWPRQPSIRTANLQDAVNEYIEMALEYGMELGRIEADADRAENEGWERLYHQEYRIPYLREYFKKLRERANANAKD